MFNLEDDNITERYKISYNTLPLAEHIANWKDVLEFSEIPADKLDEYNKHAEQIRSEYKSCDCVVPNGAGERMRKGYTCYAIKLAAPRRLVMMLITAETYGVPQGVAYHQLYCKDTEHANCF